MRKILIIAVALLLCIGVAACSDDVDSGSVPSDSAPSESMPTQDVTESPDTTPAEPDSSQTIAAPPQAANMETITFGTISFEVDSKYEVDVDGNVLYIIMSPQEAFIQIIMQDVSNLESLLDVYLEFVIPQTISAFGVDTHTDTGDTEIAGTKVKNADFILNMDGKVFDSRISAFVVEKMSYIIMYLDAEADYPGVYADLMQSIVAVSPPDDSVAFNSNAASSQISVEEYVWSTRLYHYVALVFENNGNTTVQMDAQVILRDTDGNNVGVKNDSIYAFEPGVKTAIVFPNDEEFSSVEYNLTVKEESRFKGIISYLDIEYNLTSDKAVFSVTNNGGLPASFVEYVVLFFNGSEVVNYDWGFIIDSDDEIKPGNTEYREGTCYDRFDSVLIYLAGRAD